VELHPENHVPPFYDVFLAKPGIEFLFGSGLAKWDMVKTLLFIP